MHAPPVAQHRQQLRGQHHVPIVLALPLFDADHHPATVDIGRPEVDGFRDAQAGGVAGRLQPGGKPFENLQACAAAGLEYCSGMARLALTDSLKHIPLVLDMVTSIPPSGAP
jgi:hypothetical protein